MEVRHYEVVKNNELCFSIRTGKSIQEKSYLCVDLKSEKLVGISQSFITPRTKGDKVVLTSGYMEWNKVKFYGFMTYKKSK